MSKEMLEYNQDLMDQAKQMISGGKYKKKAGDSVKKERFLKRFKIKNELINIDK